MYTSENNKKQDEFLSFHVIKTAYERFLKIRKHFNFTEKKYYTLQYNLSLLASVNITLYRIIDYLYVIMCSSSRILMNALHTNIKKLVER